MIANLLNIRNIAILAGLCATAFAIQSLRINWLKADKRELKIELIQAQQTISNYKEASQTNQSTIAELSAANQQCALEKQINLNKTRLELTRHEGALSDLSEKYKRIKDYADKQTPHICGYKVTIDPELLNSLYKN